MKKFLVYFTGHTISGLGGGYMGPVTVESWAHLEAKDFDEAAKQASLVAKAIKQGVYSIEPADLSDDDEEETSKETPKTLDEILGS